MSGFSVSGPHSQNGFLLLFLLPCLLLAILFLLGTARAVQLSHQRMAMQARIDVCALDILTNRKKFVREIITGNRIIRLSALAVSMSRGLKALAGPAGILLGSMGEAALVKLNRSTALMQNARMHLQLATELKKISCPPTPHSRGPAFCIVSPAISSALVRERALFPDLSGPLVSRSQLLLRVRCHGGKETTVMRLDGNPALSQNDLTDQYEI